MATPRVSAVLCALTSLIPAVMTAQGEKDGVNAAKISALIRIVTSKNRSQIVHQINYPFGMHYPVPPITSEAECLKRFDEVFDASLLGDIAKSDSNRDWERVGWRGIMLHNGEVWLDEDYKIIAINHETAAEKAVRARLIGQQKARLPAALRDFDQPVLEWTTPHLLIRVDKKGDDLRLVVFSGHSYAKPIHILFHGDLKFDGSGGNYYMDWKSEGRTYRLNVIAMSGEYSSYKEFDAPAASIGVEDRVPALDELGKDRSR